MKIPDDILRKMQDGLRKVYANDPVKLKYELQMTAHIAALGHGVSGYWKELNRLKAQL